jgi:hypothetical protein
MQEEGPEEKPRSTPEDGPRELSADEIAGLFEAVGESGQAGGPQTLQGQLTARAAVVGTFTPQELAADLGPSGDLKVALGRVLENSVVITQGSQRRWMLEPAARSAALAELGPGAARVLESFKAPRDELSEMVAGLLHGRAPEANALATPSLRNLVNAAEWCALASDVAARMLPVWRQELEKRELIEPFHGLVGEHFVGREKELERLRDFVDVVPPSSVFKGWSRWLSNARHRGSRAPFVLHGVGGIGKSTLMAHFILEHAAVAGERAFPFVYLDFDRVSLDPMNVLTLVSEALRQLGAQFPHAANRLEILRSSLRDIREASRVEQMSGSSLVQNAPQVTDKRRVAEVASTLAEFMHGEQLADRPFLLVLDTFEEVQARGDAAVGAVFNWLESMSGLRSLKTVIAGRAPIEEQKVEETIQLGNLGDKPALAFLENEGLPRKLAATILKHVGGNPLSLQLAVRLVKNDDAVATWQSDGEALGKLDDLQIQGYLYTRLLKYIDDERVRALAHPGLVIRRITREIISEVLAPVVGLTVTSPQDADALYRALRSEVSLVFEDGDALVHRKDVRAVMLPLQRAHDPDLFNRLNRAAADYYRRQRATPQTWVELAYHRLMLDENPFGVLAEAPIEVVRGLGSAVEEFSDAAALALRVWLGLVLKKSEVKKLPDETWEIYAFRKSTELIGENAPASALELLNDRKSLAGSRVLAYPRALALVHMLDWEAAEEALALTTREPTTPWRRLPNDILEPEELAIRPWVERGFLQWYQFRDTEAEESFKQAVNLATNTRGPMLHLEALLGSLAVARGRFRPGKPQFYPPFYEAYFAMLGDVAIEDWRRGNLPTLRRVVFLGFADEAAAASALQHFGLRLRSRKQIQRFLWVFADDIDRKLRENLEGLGMAAGSHDTEERLSIDNLLTAAEREAASRLAHSSKKLGNRIVPFLRGRFSSWRVPLRTAVLATFSKEESIAPFLMVAFPEIYGALGRAPSLAAPMLVDRAVELAEEQDHVLELLETCIRGSDAKDTRRPEALLRALERYTEAGFELEPTSGPAAPEEKILARPR